jgi:DNA-binding MarR family transcriptional regulator
VTGIVRRLESLGLVAQTRSAEDSRRRHLTLTAKGQRVNRQRKGTVKTWRRSKNYEPTTNY